MSRRTNTKTTKPLLMLTVAVAAVLVVISSLCIVFASEDTSAAGMHQVHFEPNGGKVYKGDVESPYYVAVSDEAQMVYVPGSTFTVRVPDNTHPFNDELDFKLMNGELVVDESDELDSYFEVSYAGSGETYVFTVVVKAALFTEKTGWDKIVIHPQKDGTPTTAWGAVRLIPVANVTTGDSTEFEGNGHTTSLDIANSGSSTVYLTINNNMNYDEEEYRYVKPGYTLRGWSPDQVVTSTSEIYPENMVMNVTSDVNLYAVWEPNTYTIRLVVGDTVSDYQIAFNQNLDTTHMKNMVPSDMVDYAIVGWSTTPLNSTTESHRIGNSDINSTVYRIQNETSLYPLNIKYREVPADGILTLYPIYAFKIQMNATTEVQLTNDQGCYYFTGTSTSGTITVSGGSPYLFIDDLAMTHESASPFIISGSAVANVSILGDSSFTGGKTNNKRYGFAGINVQTGTTLNVTKLSTGTLTATGGTVRTGNSGSSYTKSGPGIGSNWDTTDGNDLGCGTICVYGGTIIAVAGTAYVNTNYTGYYNYGGIYRSYLVGAQGIGGNGARMVFDAGMITATSGKIWGYSAYQTDTVVSDTVGTVANPLYYVYDPESTIIEIKDAIVTTVGRSGGTVVGDELVEIRFNVSDGSTIGGAQTVTLEFDGNEYTLNLGGVTVKTGTTFSIASNMIKEGASVKLNTQKGNYYTGSASKNGNPYYTITIRQDTSTNHGDVNIFVNGSSLNSNDNYFGTIDQYESFNIAGSRTSTTITITLDLLDTYVLNGVTVTHDGSSSAASFEKDGNTYIITATVYMGNGSGGGVTNNINLEIDRKLDTVEFIIHYSGDQANIGDILSAMVNSPEPISTPTLDGVRFSLWKNGTLVDDTNALQSSTYFTVTLNTSGDDPVFRIVVNAALRNYINYQNNRSDTIRVDPIVNGAVTSDYGYVLLHKANSAVSTQYGDFRDNNDLQFYVAKNTSTTVNLTFNYGSEYTVSQNVYHNDSRTYLIESPTEVIRSISAKYT